MDNKQLRIFRRHLREIEREVARGLKDQTTCCGVSLAQCHVILEVGELGNPSIVELADRLKLDASTLSRTVDGLVKAGLLDRAENPRNRRSSLISLTGKGREAHESINRMCDDFYAKLFAKIPANRHGRLLEAIELLAGIFTEIRFEECGGTVANGPCRE